MGMAASQARLLTITARMHDVEFQAQSIQNAKIELATQSDEVYKEYVEALDASTLTFKDKNNNTIVANFNNLCGVGGFSVNKKRYMFKNQKGQIVVPQDILEGYNAFKSLKNGNNAYDFAAYMLSGCDENAIDELNKSEEIVKADHKEKFESDLEEYLKAAINSYLKDCPGSINEYDGNFDKAMADVSSGIESHKRAGDDKLSQATIDAWETFLEKKNSQEYLLYQSFGDSVYEDAGRESEYNFDDFWYYVNYFMQIEENYGSIVSIKEYDGIDGVGNAASDTDWLLNMIQSGQLSIITSNIDAKGNLSTNATGVPGDDRLATTNQTSIDKTAYAKAEAEYEHKTKIINQKDKKFDMDLNKLETERTALKTEYESVKKVIENNIERTFGIFS